MGNLCVKHPITPENIIKYPLLSGVERRKALIMIYYKLKSVKDTLSRGDSTVCIDGRKYIMLIRKYDYYLNVLIADKELSKCYLCQGYYPPVTGRNTWACYQIHCSNISRYCLVQVGCNSVF